MLGCWLESKVHFSLLLQQTKVYKDSWRLSIVGCHNQLSGSDLLSLLTTESTFPLPLSYIWIDHLGIQDRYMRTYSSDYFPNSRKVAYILDSMRLRIRNNLLGMEKIHGDYS